MNQSQLNLQTYSKEFVEFVTEREALIDSLLVAWQTTDKINETLSKQLLLVFIASDYVLEQIRQSPQAFIKLYKSGDLEKSYSKATYHKNLTHYLEQVTDYQGLESALRKFRQREMLRLIWRDVLGLASIEEVMFDTANLAEVCITEAVNCLQTWLAQRFGEPVNTAGEIQRLQVIAMGKLGGDELNLSSDVDLILCYPESGMTSNPENSISNQQFFIKLAQQLSLILSKVTSEGFVFRVDMRLRPYGESGPLVMNFISLREYFAKSARQWERYAFVKARIFCGDPANNQKLLALCQEFTYQDSADKKIMRVLKNIKLKICQQVLVESLQNNIKLGEGGIRELEFIVQVFQLIYGVKRDKLRRTHLLSVLRLLKEKTFIAPDVADKLIESYIFLRTLENRIQAVNDQQEHRLPRSPLMRERLAKTLNFADWNDLSDELSAIQNFVTKQFAKVFNQSFEEISITKAESIRNINFKRRVAVEELLVTWRKERLSGVAINESLWKAFFDSLTSEALKHSDPAAVAERTIDLLPALIEQQPEVLSTLETHIEKLVRVGASSPWLASQLISYPKLLISLVSSNNIELPANLFAMQMLLQKKLLRLENADELESFLNLLAAFKGEYSMRIAVADVLGQIKVMRVSDLLTDLAITIIRQILHWVWQEMVQTYGHPKRQDGKLCELDFVVVAYGKLGGIELSYSSDLDLVFLHDADENALTDGKNEITGAQFYQRLGRRIIELLSVSTANGRLYKVDTQLKPMGKAGLLVNHFSTYENYQRNSAWTWEHQALVRARVIAGDVQLTEAFSQLRKEILCQPRDITQLRTDVLTMRKKMRSEKSATAEGFNLKDDPGGITDIEFLAQYVVLAWAQRAPFLLMFPDNIRIFETCESAGLLSRRSVDLLCDAYRTFRAVSHRLVLQDKPGVVSDYKFKELRKKVKEIWQFLLH